jgi:DNA-binding response OmpR family regulator
MLKIVVIEDNLEVLSLVQNELLSLAYEVSVAQDGLDGLNLVRKNQPDLVILDIMLPRLNGLSILKQLRQDGFASPILFLTARDSEADLVAGLELGADDYVVKPFSLRELSARAAALLRRQNNSKNPATRPSSISTLNVNDCVLNETSKVVKVCDIPCTLSSREFALLQLLMSNLDRALTREWLLKKVWGRDYDGVDRTLDACVLRLRDRLGRTSQIAKSIRTVRGVGYRLHTETSS